MATQCLTNDLTTWVSRLSRLLDARVGWRLLPLLTGLLFAHGRRTVSSWLRAADLSDDYQDYYYFLSILGRKVKSLAGVLLVLPAVLVVAERGNLLQDARRLPRRAGALLPRLRRRARVA